MCNVQCAKCISERVSDGACEEKKERSRDGQMVWIVLMEGRITLLARCLWFSVPLTLG